MVQEVPLGEITLRKYEKPYESSERDIIVDILMILENSRKTKTWLTSFDIKDKVEEIRKSNSLEIKGIAESNIRRQLKRLRDNMLIDKQENKYRISEFNSLSELFERNIEKFLIPQIVERVKEHLKVIEK